MSDKKYFKNFVEERKNDETQKNQKQFLAQTIVDLCYCLLLNWYLFLFNYSKFNNDNDMNWKIYFCISINTQCTSTISQRSFCLSESNHEKDFVNGKKIVGDTWK